MAYLAEIYYRGELHDTMWIPNEEPQNLEGIKQTIGLHYPAEEEHIRISLVNEETRETKDITGDIKCGPPC